MHGDCGLHDTGWGHPEHQGRLPAIVRAIERDTPVLLPRLAMREAVPAGIDALQRVHDAAHVERVRALARHAAEHGQLIEIEGDTIVSPATWEAATAAAGCVIDAATLVARGESATAFALVRPPGHHATADRIMGFCFFNNIAVAARAVQAQEAIERVLIVDWDVHHGNGTQDIFYRDPSVYYLSLHQHPWYPGTGLPDERGEGPGRGTTRNVPVAAGTGRAVNMQMFDAALDQAFAEFEPGLILVSAGYDSMAGDPLGGLLLEPADYHRMTRALMDRAAATAGGRVVCALEGGYAPVRVGQAVVATLRALCGYEVA
jgi:acetoin utilization deacetylase AcuC-like enzyme